MFVFSFRGLEEKKGKLTTSSFLCSLSFAPPPTHTTGGTLNRLVSRQASKPHKTLYSHAQAACWAQQIAEALAYLHGSNPIIVHRDLKLANVLLRAPRDPRARKRMETGEPSVRGAEGASAGGGVAVAGGGGAEGASAAAAVPAAAGASAAAAPAAGASAAAAACCGQGEEETPTVALCDFGLSSSFIDPSVPFRRSELHAAAQARAAAQQQQESAVDTLSSVREGSGGLSIRGISPTGGVSLDTRRGSSVREQFARVSRGEEMDDHALAERSAAVGASLPPSALPPSASAPSASARPSRSRAPPPAPSASFGRSGGRSRARRPVLGAKGGTAAEMTGRTGSFM